MSEATIAILETVPRGAAVVLDLAGLREASAGALAALMVAMAAVRGAAFEDRYLLFRVDRLHGEIADALALVARDARDVVPVLDLEGRFEALGRLPSALRDTLDLVQQRGWLTASELRGMRSLLPSAASNRLRELYLKRLARREEHGIGRTGGREYVYLPLLW